MAIVSQKTLVGWKAIAAYFSRDERTVMRWAAERGMPVQRVAGRARASVYAWPDDLDAWLRKSPGDEHHEEPQHDSVIPEPVLPIAPIAPLPVVARRRWAIFAGLGVVCVAVALAAGFFSHSRANAIEPEAGFRDPAARASYLQATFDWNLRTRESLARAIQEYGSAIGRDPGVADSYVGLANSYLLIREYGSMPDSEAYAHAAAAARVAMSLNPDAMDAHRALGFVAFWSAGDIATARREFATALTLAPKDPLTHHWLANALSANGETQAALREISTARLLDPTATSTLVDFGWISYVAGEKDEARLVLASLSVVVAQNAALHRVLANIAMVERKYADYLRESATLAHLRGDAETIAFIDRQAAAFRSGGVAALQRVLVDHARQNIARTGNGYYGLATALAVAGDEAGANDALTTACSRHEVAAIVANGDAMLLRTLSREKIDRACGHSSLINT